MPDNERPARFLTLDQAADELNTSNAQIYALIRRRHIRALKIGGRGQWRIERTELEAYIERTYAETDEWVQKHPFTGHAADDGADSGPA